MSRDSFNNDSPELMDTCGFISEVNLLVQGHINSIGSSTPKPMSSFGFSATQKRTLEDITLQNFRVLQRVERHKYINLAADRNLLILGHETECFQSKVALCQPTLTLKHGFIIVFLLTKPSMAEALPNRTSLISRQSKCAT